MHIKDPRWSDFRDESESSQRRSRSSTPARSRFRLRWWSKFRSDGGGERKEETISDMSEQKEEGREIGKVNETGSIDRSMEKEFQEKFN